MFAKKLVRLTAQYSAYVSEKARTSKSRRSDLNLSSSTRVLRKLLPGEFERYLLVNQNYAVGIFARVLTAVRHATQAGLGKCEGGSPEFAPFKGFYIRAAQIQPFPVLPLFVKLCQYASILIRSSAQMACTVTTPSGSCIANSYSRGLALLRPIS
jgi:hypothetical protein